MEFVMYLDILAEIRDGCDQTIGHFYNSDEDDYDGVEKFEDLTDDKKVEVWMNLVSCMSDHEPFPMIPNFF